MDQCIRQSELSRYKAKISELEDKIKVYGKKTDEYKMIQKDLERTKTLLKFTK